MSMLFYGTNGVRWGGVFSCTQTIVTVYLWQKDWQSREAMRCIPRNPTVTGSVPPRGQHLFLATGESVRKRLCKTGCVHQPTQYQVSLCASLRDTNRADGNTVILALLVPR